MESQFHRLRLRFHSARQLAASRYPSHSDFAYVPQG